MDGSSIQHLLDVLSDLLYLVWGDTPESLLERLILSSQKFDGMLSCIGTAHFIWF